MILFHYPSLREITEGDRELELSLLEQFGGTIARCIDSVNQHAAESWAAPLHELRGAAMAMYATSLAEYCALGEHTPPPDLEAYRRKLTELAEQTLQAIRAQLQS